MRPRDRLLLSAAVFCTLTGCARAPSIDVLGSFFPIWFFCIVAGVIATVAVRYALARTLRNVDLGPPILIYPSFAVLVACLIWLLFFD